MDIIFFIFLCALAYIAYSIVKRSNDITGRDFFAYKAKYPNLVKGGKVYCMNCGSYSIAMLRERQGSLFFDGIMVHTCRNCGTRLYFSKN